MQWVLWNCFQFTEKNALKKRSCGSGHDIEERKKDVGAGGGVEAPPLSYWLLICVPALVT
jgi:hypothetical protein